MLVSMTLEFMQPAFLKEFHEEIYNACHPPGNISSIDWSILNVSQKVETVKCLPLRNVLDMTNVKYIDLFVLDVEGAELNVLSSINWNSVTFGVICVEVEEKYRSKKFVMDVVIYLEEHGYRFVEVIKRNAWFVHSSFVASSRFSGGTATKMSSLRKKAS